MQPNELTALLTKTDEVALWPIHVEAQIPYISRNKRGALFCPSGLVRARVIENGRKWIERRPIAQCGDQDYEIHRRNGVLVEIKESDFANHDNFSIVGTRLFLKRSGKRNPKPYPHTSVARLRTEKDRVIRMVVSRKAIIAAWGEYELIEAERTKISKEHEDKHNRLRSAQASLMGFDGNLNFWDSYAFKADHGYLGANYETINYDAEGKYIENSKDRREVGHIEITIEQAEKILNMLTPKQKAKLAG